MNTVLSRGVLFILALLILVACPGSPTPSGPPDEPTDLRAVAEQEQIRLIWQDNSNNEAGFRIFRREDGAVPVTTQITPQQETFSELATVAANITEYIDTEVDLNTSYFYRIEAYNSQGQSKQMDMNGSNSVRPEPPAGDVRLRVLRSGSGSGVVSSNPAGIQCDQKTGGDCSEIFALGETVTLSAAPEANSSFEGWSGACSGNGTCQVTMNEDLADENGNVDVTVNFLQTGYTLSVEKTGSGTGKVFDANSGGDLIDCGTDCSEVESLNFIIVIEAEATAPSLFAGWENCPQVENQGKWCRLTLTSDVTVKARFTPPVPVIDSFTASPVRVPVNGEVSISWNVTGSDDTVLTLEASDEDGTRLIDIGDRALNDSLQLSITKSTTFTLKATNEAGESEIAEQTVTVGDAPTITKFEPVDNDFTVAANSELTLTWGVAGEEPLTVVLSGEGVNRDLSDDGDKRTRVTVPASGIARYTLTATNAFGSDTKTIDIQIGTPPSIGLFRSDDSTVTAGSSVMLFWTVSGANALEIDNGIGPVSGTSKTVIVNSTTTYALTARNDFGEARATTTVSVGDPVVITSFGQQGGDTVVDAASLVTLEWTVTGTPSELTLSGPNIPFADRDVLGEANHSFTAPATPGDYVYTLTANNVYGSPDTATYTLSVGPANTPPETSPSSATVESGSSVIITLEASDADGDLLAYIVVLEPAHGSLSGSGATRTYTPTPGFVGADEIRFKVNDGQADSNVSKVDITVTNQNTAPETSPSSATVEQDSSVLIPLQATDADGDPLSYIIVLDPANGSLSGTGASRTYTPNPGYSGPDELRFKVNDGLLDSNVSKVDITVTAIPLNNPPVATDSSAAVDEGASVSLSLGASDPDGDSLTYQVTDPPDNGSLTGTGASRTYTPNAGFDGADSFKFKANDGELDSNEATVTITVLANTAPETSPSSATVEEGSSVVIPLIASDADGDALSYIIVLAPTHGTLSGADDSPTYTPDLGFVGEDELRFKVNDGLEDSNVSKVSISVTAIAAGAPEISNFEASETSIEAGDEVTFSWTISDQGTLTKLEIKREEVYEEIDKTLTSLTESVDETTKYRLKATNTAGSTLTAPPITVSVEDD